MAFVFYVTSHMIGYGVSGPKPSALFVARAAGSLRFGCWFGFVVSRCLVFSFRAVRFGFAIFRFGSTSWWLAVAGGADTAAPTTRPTRIQCRSEGVRSRSRGPVRSATKLNDVGYECLIGRAAPRSRSCLVGGPVPPGTTGGLRASQRSRGGSASGCMDESWDDDVAARRRRRHDASAAAARLVGRVLA